MKQLFSALIGVLLFTSFTCVAQDQKSQSADSSKATAQKTPVDTSVIFIIADEPPTFPGGEDGLRQFIAQHVVYPKKALKKDIQGRVYVKFCITETGKISKVSVAKGVHELLDNAAMDVIRKLPRWNPAKNGGVPVAVWYTVPINFQIAP